MKAKTKGLWNPLMKASADRSNRLVSVNWDLVWNLVSNEGML